MGTSPKRRFTIGRPGWLMSIALSITILPTTVVAQSVAPEVADALAKDGPQRVLVLLEAPVARSATPMQRRQAVRRAQDSLLAAVPEDGLALRYRYDSIPALAATLSAAGLDALRTQPGVRAIVADEPGGGGLSESVPIIGADFVQDTLGFDGTGVTVAVIDTGVQANHPDLAGSVVDERCFCSGGCCPNGSSNQSGPGAANDDHGHGTHVSGIVASRGVSASRGVAPGASLIAVKVLDSQNRFCCTSDVLAAMDWVATQHPEVRAVNMSLGTDALFAGDCDNVSFGLAFATATAALNANGTAVFASSLNDGEPNRMTAPACVSDVISVGSVSKSDVVAASSNGGATLDLLAPGVSIFSTWIGSSQRFLSGTSMASPHAAGAAALLFQASPALDSDGVLDALASTGVPILDARNGFTQPRVDVAAAFSAIATCGDGNRELAEQCDDGNTDDGDGCDAACRVEPCHACSGEPSVCAPAVRLDCRDAAYGIVTLRDTDDPRRDKLQWKWLRGAATDMEDFGDPLAADDFHLCVFDHSSGVARLAAGASIPAGGTCAGRDCWKQLGSKARPRGYRYADRDGGAGGVRKMMLRSGEQGKARIDVQAQGESLALPGSSATDRYFDIDGELTLQLTSGRDGACWQTVIEPAAVQKNSAEIFRAKVR